MVNQVRAEAVFDTSSAVASADAYTAAINRAMAAQMSLSVAIQNTIAQLQSQSNAFGGVRQAVSNSALAMQATIGAINGIAQSYNTLAANALNAAQQMQRANQQRPPAQGGAGSSAGGAGNSSGSFLGLSSAQMIGGYFSVSAITDAAKNMMKVSDAWIDLGGRIKIATGNAADFNQVQDQIFDIAQKDRVAFSGVADQYSRIMTSGAGMHVTSDQALALTEALTDIGRASHRSSGEITSMNIEFTHMMANGLVQARQLTPMMMAYPSLLKVIEENWKNTDGTIGLSHSKMTAMMRDGELKASDFLNAILRGRQKVADLAANAPMTITQAMTQLENAWTRMVGNLSKQSGFTDSIVASIQKIISLTTSSAGMGLVKVAMDAISGAIKIFVDLITSDKLVTAVNDIVVGIGKAWEKTKDFADAVMYLTGSFKSFVDYVKLVEAMPSAVGRLFGPTAISDAERFGLDMLAIVDRATMASTAATTLAAAVKKAGDEAKLSGWTTTTKKDVADVGDGDIYNRKLEDRKKHMDELIAAARDQLALDAIKAKFSGDDLIAAQSRLDLEKKITEYDRQRLPDKVAALQLLIQQDDIAKKAASDAQKDRPFEERVKLLDTQINEQKALATGNQQLIDDARMQVALEKIMTDEVMKRNKALAETLIKKEKELELAKQAAAQSKEWSGIYTNIGNTMVDAFIAAGKAGQSFGQALKNLVPVLSEMIIKALVLQPIVKAISDSLGGKTQSALGGSPSSFWGSLFGGGAGGAGTDVGLGTWDPVIAAANGKAFFGGHIQAFAGGGVVNQPTMFSHAGGMGLMGEAGNEAILPLTRLNNGKLGVHAGGASKGGDTFNISLGVSGDLTDATRMRLMADMDSLMAKHRPGIVRDSVSAVQASNRSNPNFLRR